MFFLIPIIIVKASVLLGPKDIFEPDELEDFYEAVGVVETKGLQREVDAAVQALTRVHSAMVLLRTAMVAPAEHVFTYEDHTSETIFGHIVPAYAKDEVGGNGKSGWIFDTAVKAIEIVESANNTTLGMKFANEVIQKVEIPIDAHATWEGPLLQLFVERFRTYKLSTDFDPGACLKVCRDSVADLGSHFHATRYALKALNLLRLLWGPNAKQDLAQVTGWLKGASNILTDTENWLKQRLQLDPLFPLLTALYDSNKDGAKLALGKITAMLETNRRAFLLTYGRFMDKEDGLETVVTALRDNASQPQKKEWDNLLAATYGAIAWRIFWQANMAIDMARLVLEEG